MARFGRLSGAIFVFSLIVSCQDDEIQTNFYDYQIERLLSGGDTAIWQPIAISGEGRTLSSCQDSVYLIITQLDDDSLGIRELMPLCDGSPRFDTLSLGKAKASAEGIFFTDSIVFASGRYWIINEAFSLTFGFTEEDANFRYQILQ